MKNTEPWFRALAGTAREEDVAADPDWEALASGQLSAEDEAALVARAQRTSAGRVAYEAFRPLDEVERGEIEAKILAQRGARDPPAVTPLRRRRVLWAFAAAAALAGAFALFVPRFSGEAMVPAYELAMAGGEQMERGTPDAQGSAPRFGPGSMVEIVARPKVAVAGKVDVRGALVQDGRSQAWRPPLEITPEGVAHIAGTRETVFPGVPDGAWELVLAVGRPGALPQDPAAGNAEQGVQLLRAKVVLVAAPPPALR
jgi:hypothetical protein